ncbi:MAG TPA: hypothetical protein VIH59_06450 [Candidatus Tectomicrobia bacterium]
MQHALAAARQQGGREAGSDAWKSYMRRQTSTTYYGTAIPTLPQGMRFDVGD